MQQAPENSVGAITDRPHGKYVFTVMYRNYGRIPKRAASGRSYCVVNLKSFILRTGAAAPKAPLCKGSCHTQG